jgi:hypothetical protein
MKTLTPIELQALAHVLCDALGVKPAEKDVVICFGVDDGETVGNVVGEWLYDGDLATLADRRETLRTLCWELKKLGQEITAAESRS